MKTILAAATFLVFGSFSVFAQTPDTSKISNKVLDNKELILKLHADSLKAITLVPDHKFELKPSSPVAPQSDFGAKPVPMPTAKLDNRKNFPMPVAKPDSSVDFKLRVKKAGSPNR